MPYGVLVKCRVGRTLENFQSGKKPKTVVEEGKAWTN